MQTHKVLETCLYLDNLQAGEDFYKNVLGLKLYSKVEDRHVFFYCGDSMLLLFNPKVTSKSDGKVPAHGAKGQGHVAFGMNEDDIDGWLEHLQQHKVKIESTVEWPAGGFSIYFRDTAGNSVELTTPLTWGL